MAAVMDPEVPTLVSKISELGRQVEQTSKTDAGSAESREYRRALLKTSRKLSDALRNEGQIVEDYLYSVGQDVIGIFGALQLTIVLVDNRCPSIEDRCRPWGF